jgi:hypothetical protein
MSGAMPPPLCHISSWRAQGQIWRYVYELLVYYYVYYDNARNNIQTQRHDKMNLIKIELLRQLAVASECLWNFCVYVKNVHVLCGYVAFHKNRQTDHRHIDHVLININPKPSTQLSLVVLTILVYIFIVREHNAMSTLTKTCFCHHVAML